MGKEQHIEKDGVVLSTNRGLSVVQLDDMPEHTIQCKRSGVMNIKKIRILPGDRVRICISAYDLNKGRIIYRYDK